MTTPCVPNRGHDMPPTEKLKEQVIAALCTIVDPEFPINIYDLGLVYDLEVTPLGVVMVRMTLTAPGCPVAQSLPDTVKVTLGRIPGVREVEVEIVWDPPWNRDMMNEKARWQMEML
ncbi:MAG: DUF59 domain-containing protein [Magnetococcales bacterium]|nr:DUF59 domain-containing protein [Magnetococcales bacterium]MBF0149745.1 DUF59 domain-containing protein [Magnetococcales bacterium]